MRLLCAIAAATLLAACPATPSNDGGNPENDAGPGDDGGSDAGKPKPDAGFDAGFGPVAAADWCAKKALAECLRDVRCLRLSAANVPACVSQKAVLCDATAYARGVAEGRLGYAPDAGGHCLDAYAQGSCEGVPPSCDGLFVGKVPPDGGCVLAEDCTADGFCFMYDNQCPHRCRPYSARGERCDGFTMQCRPPDGCEIVDAGVLGCVEKRDAGAPCTSYSACGLGMVCFNSKCVQQTAQEGQACLTDTYYPYCDTQLFCRQPPPPQGSTTRPPGVCEVRSGLGGVCSGYDSCLPSLRCSGIVTTGTCVGKAALGEPCSQYGDCQDQLFCNPLNTRCAPLPGDGGDCSYDNSRLQCAAGFWCDFSSPTGDYRCLARQPLGAPCSYDSSCLSNHCEYGTLPDAGPGLVCVAACSQRADAGP